MSSKNTNGCLLAKEVCITRHLVCAWSMVPTNNICQYISTKHLKASVCLVSFQVCHSNVALQTGNGSYDTEECVEVHWREVSFEN